MARKKHIWNQREVKPNMSNKELAATWPEIPRLDINKYKKDIVKTAETESGKEYILLLDPVEVWPLIQNGAFIDQDRRGTFLLDKKECARCYFVDYQSREPETKCIDHSNRDPIQALYNLSE